LGFDGFLTVGIQDTEFEEKALDLNIGPSLVRQAFVVEEGFDLGVGGDEVG